MRALLLFMMTLLLSTPALANDRVLLIVSGHGRDEGRTRPGFEFEEYAQAWTVFRANGLVVDVASPAGGAVKPDDFERDKPYNAATMTDRDAMARLATTKRIDAVDPRSYAAIYVIGGGGAMFDLFADPALPALLRDAYQAGAVVGGVCHGPAVFSLVNLPGGRPLVAGRRVTGFTDAEELEFGNKWVREYPVSLQAALQAKGARFAEGSIMIPHVVVDGRLVTGQNPSSSAKTAEAMLRAMGRTPVDRALYPDERSLLLVGRYLAGEYAVAAAELKADPAAYDIMLIGQYGNVMVKRAGSDDTHKSLGLALGSGLVDHSQKMTVAARATAEKKTVGHRS